jgi:acetoin utilization protein AcuB
MLVGKIMTLNPMTASPDTTHREAMELLRKHGVRRLPILDHGRLVGIVEEKELLSTQPSPATSLSIHEIYYLLEKLTLRQIMTRPVYTVTEGCPVEAAARVMIDQGIGCLPVMRGEELVGVVTETDIFKTLVKVLGGGEAGIRFSVRAENVPGKLAEIAGAVTEAGGDIISVVTWTPEDKPDGALTIKERGADAERLRRLLAAAGAELLDISEDGVCEVRLFGKG